MLKKLKSGFGVHTSILARFKQHIGVVHTRLDNTGGRPTVFLIDIPNVIVPKARGNKCQHYHLIVDEMFAMPDAIETVDPFAIDRSCKAESDDEIRQRMDKHYGYLSWLLHFIVDFKPDSENRIKLAKVLKWLIVHIYPIDWGQAAITELLFGENDALDHFCRLPITCAADFHELLAAAFGFGLPQIKTELRFRNAIHFDPEYIDTAISVNAMC